MKHIEVGAIVRIVAPGSRESEGEARAVPALVLHQWPDGSLQLYVLHFQGSPLLQNAVRPEAVEMVMSRTEFDLIFSDIHKRLTALENVVAPQTGRNPRADELKFALADDPR